MLEWDYFWPHFKNKMATMGVSLMVMRIAKSAYKLLIIGSRGLQYLNPPIGNHGLGILLCIFLENAVYLQNHVCCPFPEDISFIWPQMCPWKLYN